MKKDLDRLMKEMKVAALYAEGSASADPTIYYLFNGVNINARFVKMAGKPAYVIHKSIEREEAVKTGHRLINMSLIDFRKILDKNRNTARANALVTKYLLDRLRVSGTVAFYGSAPLGNAYNYLGLTYKRLGLYDEAAQAYVKAIQLQPQNYVFLFNLGMVMYAANSYDNAATAFQKAIQIKPEDADCHYMLGKTYAQQGNIPASMREYNILQKLEPKLAKDLSRFLKL